MLPPGWADAGGSVSVRGSRSSLSLSLSLSRSLSLSHTHTHTHTLLAGLTPEALSAVASAGPLSHTRTHTLSLSLSLCLSLTHTNTLTHTHTHTHTCSLSLTLALLRSPSLSRQQVRGARTPDFRISPSTDCQRLKLGVLFAGQQCRVALLGADHREHPAAFATPAAIQRTEVPPKTAKTCFTVFFTPTKKRSHKF